MLKRSDKNRGFTLTEVIVVLVILAILAAFTIPAMMGYIQKAREQKVMMNAKRAYTAAQTVLTEMYTNNQHQVAGKALVVNKIKSRMEASNCKKLVIYTKGNLDNFSTPEAYTLVGMDYKEDGIEMWYYSGAWHIGTNLSEEIKKIAGGDFHYTAIP